MFIYDDKHKYTVKETARILGISEKSLRYYDRIGLLEPFYRDPDNLYRYYTIKQFYQIELFKYAKRLGLSLAEYRSILIDVAQIQSTDYRKAHDAIDRLLARKRNELDELTRTITELERMESDLSTLEGRHIDGEPFVEELPLRCVYAIDHDPSLPFEDTSVLMRRTRVKYAEFLTEHYGFLLDVDAAKKAQVRIIKEFVVLNGYHEESDEIMHLPAGRYQSFLYRCFHSDEHMGRLADYLATSGTTAPWLIADEMGLYEEVVQITHAVRVAL